MSPQAHRVPLIKKEKDEENQTLRQEAPSRISLKFLIRGLAALIIVLLSYTFLNTVFNRTQGIFDSKNSSNKGEQSKAVCNGNGILQDTECLCFPGFIGDQCDAQDRTFMFNIDSALDSNGKKYSIVMFPDAKTASGIEFEANVEIARRLAALGHDLVIYTRFFDSITIPGAKLLSFNENQDANPLKTAFEAHKEVLNHNPDAVIFDANSDSGFYLLNLRATGAECSKAKYIVLVSHSHNYAAEDLAHAGHSAIVADTIRQKSIKYADLVLFSSYALYMSEIARQGELQNAKFFSPCVSKEFISTTVSEYQRINEKNPVVSNVNEFVFIGEFSSLGGLEDFLNALDEMHQTARNLKISFLGSIPFSAKVDPVNHIKLRAKAWPKFHVEIHETRLSEKNIISYMASPDARRVAVIPSALGSKNLVYALLLSQMPIILPHETDYAELINKYKLSFFSRVEKIALSSAMNSALRSGIQRPKNDLC